MQMDNIPKGWNVKNIGDCFRFLRTKSFSHAETESSGDVKYVHYGDIHTKYPLIISPEEIDLFVSTEQAVNADILCSGDLILLDASEDYEGTTKCVELSNLSPDDKIISGLHTIALRDDNGVFANKFKAYITSMPYVKKNFWKQISGVKVYGISKDNLKKIKVLVPPVEEQRKIAEILGTWNRAIEELSGLIAEKRELKRGLMQRLLTGAQRLPGFIKPWNQRKISEFVQIGKIIIEKGYTLTAEQLNTGDIPVIAGGKTVPYYHNKYTHDIPCITVSASGAYAGYVWWHNSKIWASDCNVLYGVNFDTRFLGFCLKNMQKQIYRMQTGGAQPHVYADSIKTLKIPDIDLAEQKAIADVLSKADSEIDLLNQQLSVLKEQKRGLMQKLLTGEIRVKVDDK